jgi:hypothetical protein
MRTCPSLLFAAFVFLTSASVRAVDTNQPVERRAARPELVEESAPVESSKLEEVKSAVEHVLRA